MDDKKHLGLRIDAETHGKLTYIASSEGRSNNNQILHWLRKNIRAFEQEHGPIDLSGLPKK